ncbi:fatty acid desaturase [Roseovarius faecimaris]|nr:fatty acid desaturase [Roseovarius faecimaris]
MSTVRQEFEIARKHTPDFGGRTLLLEVGMFAFAITATWATLADALPFWVGMIANTVFVYGIYTVVHEAVHANISSRSKNLRWVDTVAGMIACVPLWLLYHQHRRQHMEHHTHTNEDVDPDIYARGSFSVWIFIKLPQALINYFNPVQHYRDCLRFGCTKREIIYTFVIFTAYAAVLLGLLAAGYWKEVLLLWFIPWWIGQTVMLTFFTWTPHHDHTETGRYRNTRVSLFPGANVLLQGQNYHLIHHMVPSVPYYRYKPVFDEMRPLLDQNDVRIEGIWPNPANERHDSPTQPAE